MIICSSTGSFAQTTCMLCTACSPHTLCWAQLLTYLHPCSWDRDICLWIEGVNFEIVLTQSAMEKNVNLKGGWKREMERDIASVTHGFGVELWNLSKIYLVHQILGGPVFLLVHPRIQRCDPIWLTDGEASKEVRELLKCTCTTDCRRCKCANASLLCTMLCKCKCPNKYAFGPSQ